MTRNLKNDDEREVRLELKYCERCGGLWVRECGAGVVYCANCQAKVADLPAPKKKSGRITLPVGQRTLVEDYDRDIANAEKDAESDMEAMGGVA
jgi:ribosomal protein L37AE/L43A